jgi:acyl transferase domain-containing protein/NADP-dependent 3-hydroxy acid dehydrogenase YdfG
VGKGNQVTNPSEENATATTPPPLAIIGMGCLFPKAGSAEGFWANIKGGVDAVTEIPETHWKPAEHYDQDPSAPDMTYGRRGAFLEPVDFNPLDFGIAPNNIEAIDTTQLLGMVVAQQALRDAGYSTGKDVHDGRAFDRDKTSVILGVTGALEAVIPLGARLGHPIWRKALAESGVEQGVADEVVQRISDAYVPWQENSFPGLLGNVAAGRIANRFDLGGTNCVVDAACASSLGALHMAAMELYAGRSEMAITGGVDTFNDIFMYMCFSKTPALSPTGSARPFSAGGDGTILGEGLGVIVLKRLADAQRDGDTIRAVIRSIGSSSDGKGNAVYAPSAAGQVKCLLSAYGQAGISPATIELVEAHGTGTKVGDAVEAKALEAVFSGQGSVVSEEGERRSGPWCALGSVKSMIGHTKAAAGIAGLIKAALALDHKVLPPTIKVERPLEVVEAGKSALYVNTEKRPWVGRKEHPRRAGVSAFGFGGSNFHCVLEEEGAVKRGVDWDDSVVVLAFSGKSREEIGKKIEAVEGSAAWADVRGAGARSRAEFVAGAACRLVMVVRKEEGAAKALATAKKMLASQAARETWSTPEGIYFSAAPAATAGKVAALFPGQGSQYVGMMRDLACQFPEMLAALEAADEAYGQTVAGARLSDAVYPIPVFDDAARAQLEARLSQTDIAQPAIGAVSAGAWQVLRHFGVGVDAVGGHSFGEVVALAAAGRIDEGQMHVLANARGRAMAAAAKQGAAGAMLAVSASAADVQKVIDTERLHLVIANKNSPTQVVLSGLAVEIEKAEKVLDARGLRGKRLSVSAAFHSALVAEAQKPFGESVSAVTWKAGTVPVYANTTGAMYPADASAAGKLLAGQLAKPVEFVAEIEAMYAAGVRTFVEVGPGGKLCGLVKAILGEREHVAVAMDASGGRKSGIADLACVLAQVAACGHRVDVTQWDADFAAKMVGMPAVKKPAMAMRLSGANYVKPREKKAARAVVAKQNVVQAAAHVPMPPDKGRVPVNASNSQNSAVNGVSSTPSMALPQALQATQQSILMLQKMQEQTAQLHEKYLHGQELAQQTIHQLIEQQMRLLSGSPTIVKHEGTKSTKDHEEVVRRSSVPAVAAEPVKRAAVTTPAIPAPIENRKSKIENSLPVETKAPAQGDKAQQVLLDVIAEKTGYPVEMLELDMSLDTDLGIDSIKRVEILSALQTRMPEAPVVKPEDLGRLQTLRQIVAFLGDAGGTSSAHNMLSGAPAPLSMAHAPMPVERDRAQTVLLEVVAEKTGYPVEMLELDMSLDTDLGIDSIKRVEILSALQTRMPEAPVVKPEDLGRLQTLRQIVAFLGDEENETRRHEDTKDHEEVRVEGRVSGEGKGKNAGELERQVLTVVPMDAGEVRPVVALAAGAKVWVTGEGTGLSAAIVKALRARALEAEIVPLDAGGTAENLAGLVIVAPAHPSPAFIHQAFGVIQRVGPALRKSGVRGGGAFLVSVSSMDGCFALNGHTPKNPLTGGLAGLVKTAAHEWTEVACKSLDLSHDLADTAAIAEQIADEVLVKGPAEVGISATGRCETRLVKKSLNGEVGTGSIQANEVIVVTGGARGVTAAVSLAVAKAYRCRLLLLGRSALPTEEPAWLAGVRDEGAIKKAIISHTAGGGGGATPRGVEEAYRKVMGNREIASTLRQIEQAGATVLYRSLDVRDEQAVAGAIAEARATLGPIAGIIHGAGVLQDRLIEQKTPAQFEEVFSTKVGGFNALLEATKTDALKVIVAFSSSTGRFGRKGQVAYAAANEVLNKLAQREAHQRPQCRVLSVNWGPWEGGMVTPALRQIFENEGVGLIPLEAGAAYLVQEMSTPAGGPVEIVILGPTPGKAVAATGESSLVLAFERELSVASHPFLRSHVMKGKAVLPAAMMVEWLAHGAMHEHPGLAFQGFDDLRVFKGVTLGEQESVRLQVFAGSVKSQGGSERVAMELRSGTVLHARATILLGAMLPAPGASEAVGAELPLSGGGAGGWVYGDGRLFHGADLQGIASVAGWSPEGIVGTALAAPSPAAWMAQPLRSSWITDPLVMDVAFQLMILWCVEAHGVGSLPTSAASYRQFAKAFPSSGTRVQVRVIHAGEHSAEASMEFVDAGGKVIAVMNGYECVMDGSLKSAFATNALV